MTSHYEVESSTDGDSYHQVGGILHAFYDAIFKRNQLRDTFEEVTFRAVRVTREEVDAELVEDGQ